MATLTRTLKIPAPADRVWAKISDLEGVHTLMSFLVDASIDGDRRVCTMADGSRLEELILGVDAGQRRISYAITGSPFGFEFHAASWQVVEDGEASRLVWHTDVKPDALLDQLAPMIDGEAANFVQNLAS